MRQISPIFKREFLGYFRAPVAYVFLIAFLVISVSLAFSRYGGFEGHPGLKAMSHGSGYQGY